MADKVYDAVIIGGGHHGTTIMAPYLAKAGLKVGVFERLDHLGGGAVTEDLPSPGFRGNFCAHFTRLLWSPGLQGIQSSRRRSGIHLSGYQRSHHL